jgi:hypothetical protein
LVFETTNPFLYSGGIEKLSFGGSGVLVLLFWGFYWAILLFIQKLIRIIEANIV